MKKIDNAPPKPMPTTSWPDRCDYSQRDYGESLKRGMSSDRDMKVTNGREPDKDKQA